MPDQTHTSFLPGSLLTGVAEIDAQHEALFAQVVSLKNNCLAKNQLSASDAQALLDALVAHYATEEALSSNLQLDFAQHAEQHRSMLQGVSKALGEAVEGEADIFGVLRYIEYWFERHIAHEDQPLGEKLRQA